MVCYFTWVFTFYANFYDLITLKLQINKSILMTVSHQSGSVDDQATIGLSPLSWLSKLCTK